MIDYHKFRSSLQHLEAQYGNLQTLDPSQPKLIREAVAESVIQRYKTCCDCLWKVLRRYLVEGLGIPDVPNSPKPLFRHAHENHLLPSDVARWFDYANGRIATSHDYSGEKARAVLTLMDDFIRDGIALYQSLSGEEWTYRIPSM